MVYCIGSKCVYSWALYSSILQMSVGSDWRAGYCRLLEGEGREEPEGAREWSWEAVGEQGSSRGSPCTQLSHGGTAVLFHPTYRQGKGCIFNRPWGAWVVLHTAL